MKSNYYKYLSNRNPKIIDLLFHQIMAYELYFSRMPFGRSDFVIISYMYDDYRNLVHKYNVLLGENGKPFKYEMLSFESIDFSFDYE